MALAKYWLVAVAGLGAAGICVGILAWRESQRCDDSVRIAFDSEEGSNTFRVETNGFASECTYAMRVSDPIFARKSVKCKPPGRTQTIWEGAILRGVSIPYRDGPVLLSVQQNSTRVRRKGQYIPMCTRDQGNPCTSCFVDARISGALKVTSEGKE
ncbi:MAG: hypothetical protein SFV15_05405 [Polyangiaceae bacterium]|nr:hypothetical protein [Polyangiaceae bacterium]